MEDMKTKEELTEFVHDLFTQRDYAPWVGDLAQYKHGAWNSLIAKLDRTGCTLSTIRAFGEDCYSRLLFCCVQAPHYKVTGEIMVIFTVADWIWHSVIWHIPANSKTTPSQSHLIGSEEI